MRPIKIFIFNFIILVILFLLTVIFPGNGIKINDNIILRYPNIHDFKPSTKKNYKKIDYNLLNELYDKNPNPYFINFMNYDQAFNNLIFDTLKTLAVINVKTENKQVKAAIKPSTQNTPQKYQPLDFPSNNKTVLYSFFQSLINLKNSNDFIRVLHYGDSQIEGDRITSYIRNELQKRFGGSGIGMFPVVIVSEYILSVKHEISKNWKRYTIHDITRSNIDHLRFGIMLSYSRFTPVELLNDDKLHEGWINIEKSNISYDHAKSFSRCRLFYGYNRKPLIIEIYKNDKLFDAEILLPNQQLQVDEWVFDEPGSELSIRLKGEDSPDIYAIALDDSKGIAVDNIPLRGSKGLDFTKTDLEFLKEMYEKLNVKLVILQFGVNLVPLMKDDYSFYEEQLYEQLTKIKEIQPDLSIIVVGISDMSKNNAGRYETFSQILKIREAQKNAAFRAGCAFWDTFQAMGGLNSMPSWVYNDPPLARKDFTHFTYTGSKLIAKMFYKSLIAEYENYLNSK